jgi:hypothetical protein
LLEKTRVITNKAGVLAPGKGPVTVAAQRWPFTTFHLYALASGPAGHLMFGFLIIAEWRLQKNIKTLNFSVWNLKVLAFLREGVYQQKLPSDTIMSRAATEGGPNSNIYFKLHQFIQRRSRAAKRT